MTVSRVDLDWSKLLGFNHAPDVKDRPAIEVGIDVGGASACYSICGLGAKIGSKQWQTYSD